MNRTLAQVLLAAVLTAVVASPGCGEKNGSSAEGSRVPSPTTNDSSAPAYTGPSRQTWPPAVEGETGMMATGIAGMAIDKFPPALVLEDAMIRPGEVAAVPIILGRGFGSTTLKTYADRRIIITDAEGGEVAVLETDSGGRATFERRYPEAGAYFFRASVEGTVDEKTVTPHLFGVYVRPADTPLVVCDLDKTLVQSGFFQVMIGMARPFPEAARVVQRIADEKGLAVVYLTHRNDFFDAMSKAWLRANDFPPGPLFTSDVSGLLAGSGEFKTAELARLRERFENIRLAIGDKISDANAYVTNDIPAVLVADVDWQEDSADYFDDQISAMRTVDREVTVVRGWDEIEAALFGGRRYSRDAMIDRLSGLRDAARRASDDDDEDDDDDD